MSGVTGQDPPACQHPTVLQRGATEGYDICATRGAAVYNTMGPRMTFVIERGPIPDECCKKSERQKWALPPGAPKRRRLDGR